MSIPCPTCMTDNSDAATHCIACGYEFSPATTGSSSNLQHLLPGTLLRQGRYQIEKTLGQGGFGITYKGKDLTRSLNVAIKELWPEKGCRQKKVIIWPNSISPQLQKHLISKFQLEANYLSRCQHSSIAKSYEWFEENNTAYIVMEFVPGKSLYDIFKQEGPLFEERVKRYCIQVAEALKVVHNNNLLHRDIKPDNILIDSQDRPVLIDFGATREFIAGQTGDMTRVLTPGYAPYEQYGQKGKRFPATDFYALCASMYELLTGEVPVEASDRANALLQKNPSDILIPPRQLRSDLSVAIEQIILTGMKIDVGERFQTADELIDALKGQFVSPLHKQAHNLVNQGKLSEAVQAYEKLLQKESNNGEAAVELALILIHLNDSQAEAAAQKATQLKPNDGRSYGVLGLIHCRRAKWAEAVRQLQQAANLSPQEAWIQANLAWALGKSGNWQQAEMAVNMALQLDSNATFALGLQAWIAVNQQQWKPAIRAARQAITKSKQTNVNNSQQLQRWIYPCLTIALDRAVVTQQGNDVERCLQEFITQVPDSAFAWAFKGWKQASLSSWADAIQSLEQAKRQVQAPAWVLLSLGVAYEHINNIPNAIQAYEAYNQKSSQNALSQFRLGTLLGKQGEWKQARSALEKAVQLKPDYAEAYHNLGWVMLNIRNQDGQVENFREMWSSYRKTAELYDQQQKSALAEQIKEAFLIVGVDL